MVNLLQLVFIRNWEVVLRCHKHLKSGHCLSVVNLVIPIQAGLSKSFRRQLAARDQVIQKFLQCGFSNRFVKVHKQHLNVKWSILLLRVSRMRGHSGTRQFSGNQRPALRDLVWHSISSAFWSLISQQHRTFHKINKQNLSSSRPEVNRTGQKDVVFQ